MKYEIRIPLPLSLKEYQNGFTYGYVLAAREGNKKGDGDIEVQVPETPFDNLDGSMGVVASIITRCDEKYCFTMLCKIYTIHGSISYLS